MVETLTRLLVEAGPWIVFLATFVETAFFIGLLIPAEPTILIAAFLAERGYFNIWIVLAATFVGGFLGDQVGYALGRFGGAKLIAKEGRIARIWQRHEPRAARLFSQHTSLSVSFARVISFVRTLMPWFAGMTRIPYPRYVVFDLLGVTVWACGSVAIGYLAGESWEAASHVAGRTTVGIVAGVALIALIVTKIKRKRAVATTPIVRIALTGNIASGKSTVLDVWKALGAHVIDADVLARRAVEPGSPGFTAVVNAFGNGILGADGAIDRAKLRAVVFNNEDERARLEAIVHPEVARLRFLEEKQLAGKGARVVVNDIPLLFEADLHREFDVIVLVHADAATRLTRLTGLRGLADEEASAMMAAQMASEDKKSRSHVVIENTGSLEELKARATQVWQELQNTKMAEKHQR